MGCRGAHAGERMAGPRSAGERMETWRWQAPGRAVPPRPAPCPVAAPMPQTGRISGAGGWRGHGSARCMAGATGCCGGDTATRCIKQGVPWERNIYGQILDRCFRDVYFSSRMAGALPRNCYNHGTRGSLPVQGNTNNQWGMRLTRGRETPCLPLGPLSQGYMVGGGDPNNSPL